MSDFELFKKQMTINTVSDQELAEFKAKAIQSSKPYLTTTSDVQSIKEEYDR